MSRPEDKRSHSTITKNARRSALTLIEVVAALVILGGAATAMLVAQAGSVAQLQQSHTQLTAKHLAGELIATWRAQDSDLMAVASGTTKGYEGWSWRRTSEEVIVSEGVKCQIVTLNLAFENSDQPRARWARNFRWLVKNEQEHASTNN